MYVLLVFVMVILMAAGCGARSLQGGWRLVGCMLAARPPMGPANTGRFFRFLVLLCGTLFLAAQLVEASLWKGVAFPSMQGACPRSSCTAWEAQQSSRQWEPSWEAYAAEEEVLPHTVLDGMQPLGTTSVTKDEAAWLDPELKATFGGHPDFTEAHWEEMRAILRRCGHCFANTPKDLTGYHGGATHNTFSIPFKDESKAAYQRPRKYSPGEQEIIDMHCKELLEYGFIEPASKHCRHASNVVVAGKKDHATGLWTQTRFCVDLRNVNRHSLKDNTLPHRPEDLYQKVAKAKYKTTLDATKAFHQIPMATEEDRDKTAFWWKNQLYRYTSMPFGAAGATAAFVRVMDYELRHLQHCTVAYVDDIVIYTDSTAEQHLKDVEAVLKTLGDAGIRLHAGKSTFGAATVDFLGYRVGHNSIGAQEAKCKAIKDLPRLRDKTGLRSILGMMNYYKGLVGEPGGPNYSEMARPLNDLLKKEVTDVNAAWGKEQDKALQDLKDALCSGSGLGGTYLEAVLYLHGVHFTLVTDHSPLTTLMEKADLQGQHLRWAISLQEFEFSVQYRPGAKNSNADVPSRYPLPSEQDETGARREREELASLHASMGERYERGLCDLTAFALADDPLSGEEATPDVQMANVCALEIRRQIGNGPVHRLFDVHHKDELECNRAVLFDTDYPELVVDSGRLARAAWKALSQLRPTRGTHGEGTPAVYSNECYEGEPVLKPIKVDTRVLDKDFFPRARDEGVVCYEPCGGLCAGLEMLLRSGVKVKKYLYQDISVESQAVARARCMALVRRYPDLLQPGAVELNKLPSDLHYTAAEHLISAGALEGDQWVMICGFPCQDLSPAGKRAGLAGKHSKLFRQVVRLLTTLQQLQKDRPPGYLLENVSPLAHRQGTSLRDVVFPYIASIIGNLVSFDAARAGSYAHRLRAYWSNLFQNYQFNQIMSLVERPKDRVVASILRKGWHPRPVVRPDRPPHYLANVVGEPLRALPTIMATQGSRAFCPPKMGTVVLPDEQNMEEGGREVDLDEKSRAMGYSSSELRMADGLCDEQLAVILGLSMDRRAMELLFAVAEASRRGLPHSKESPQAEEASALLEPADIDWQVGVDQHPQQRQASAAEWVDKSSKFTQKVADKMGHRMKKQKAICPGGQKGQEGLGSLQHGKSSSGNKKSKIQHFSVAQYRHRHGSHFVKQGETSQQSVAVPAWSPPDEKGAMRLPRLKSTVRLTELMAGVAEQHADREQHRDIYSDDWCLRWLKSKGSMELPETEARRVKRRAERHRWDEATDEIYMITPLGKELRIPKPEDRLALVREYHARTGHWGIRRTRNLLWQRHWWADLKKDVEAVVTQCETCQRVKTHYAREEAVLTPLEIKSFMYRWSLDLAWPTRRVTRSGNSRVLIMTEHYTRFIVCVPIPDKEAGTIAAAFRNHVLSVFGAPAECLVDGGKEFEGEFEQLCRDCLIDRRVTSPDSPEGNGLTERVVRTIKFCFKKLALEKGLDYEWDELLWSLVLSYNVARQESTGVAPFTLLFAQEAVVPPDLKKAPSLNFEEEVVNEKDSRVKDLLSRAASVRRLMISAGCSLEIAQHRDTLLYEGRRGGGYRPKPHQFKNGDFVYIRQKPRTGMEVATKPAILKLVKIQRDGVVTLEDATKLREKSTVQNIAPCHLQVKDQYDCSAAIPGKHHACEVCRREDGEAEMLLCDTCNRGYHIWCLQPALSQVPEGEWQCPKCLGTGMEAAMAKMTIESDELQDKLGMKDEQLSAELPAGMRLLPADVGPYRIVKEGEPLRQASSAHKIMGEKKDMFGELPDQVNWANQDELTARATVLSKKYREQKLKVMRRLRNAPLVSALSEEAVEMRGVVQKMKRSQVREASAMDWGLELIITVPTEVLELTFSPSSVIRVVITDPS
ncbi:hypothetical protein CYMTET_47009 [Cymbomonas tetramitiformis]|uniref:Uncharacterized protein n=1 Tax=Cymbomonas tetramitiformis TaxID=36881 RepID=A0AAE0EX08_9CHLO|nr:hypothetical protein CYMTET_47009 [Cymbomonas tetramitiformis]